MHQYTRGFGGSIESFSFSGKFGPAAILAVPKQEALPPPTYYPLPPLDLKNSKASFKITPRIVKNDPNAAEITIICKMNRSISSPGKSVLIVRYSLRS